MTPFSKSSAHRNERKYLTKRQCCESQLCTTANGCCVSACTPNMIARYLTCEDATRTQYARPRQRRARMRPAPALRPLLRRGCLRVDAFGGLEIARSRSEDAPRDLHAGIRAGRPRSRAVTAAAFVAATVLRSHAPPLDSGLFFTAAAPRETRVPHSRRGSSESTPPKSPRRA